MAEEYGLDIPFNLDRRFIIEEILESIREMAITEQADEDVTITDEEVEISGDLPTTYNETSIRAILRDPAWAFVFWDLSKKDSREIKNATPHQALFLQVLFFQDDISDTPLDTIDIQVSSDCRMQYVLLSSKYKYFVVDLKLGMDENNNNILAYTKRTKIPEENNWVLEARPGKDVRYPPLLELSGMQEALRDRYINHREAY